MNDFLSQLNLTPLERRVVVVVFLVIIIVLNLLFVWPHFGEWGRTRDKLNAMKSKISDYNRVIAQDRNTNNGYQMQVAKLAQQEGGSVMEHPVDPQIQLNNTITQEARKTGVNVEEYRPGTVKTNNEFFEEHTTYISVSTQEGQLVNFLYGMGNDPAMIRVGKLDLKPADLHRYRLRGGITLTANYTKSSASKVAPEPSAKPGALSPKPPPGAKPAAAAGPRPGMNPGPGTPARPGQGPGHTPGPGPMRNPNPNPDQRRPGQNL